MTIPILSNSYKPPAVWGLPSSMTTAPASAPEGPHSWEHPTASRSTYLCWKCRAEVFVGTDQPGAISRVAGVSCAEALVRAVMES